MKYHLTTTLDRLSKYVAYAESYDKLIRHLGADYPNDKPINLLTILDSNGVLDMCWCFRATLEDSLVPMIFIAADFADSVLHHFTAKFPDDHRPARAIQAARDRADGKINSAAAYTAAEAAESSAAYADYDDDTTAAYAAACAAASAAYTACDADAGASAYADTAAAYTSTAAAYTSTAACAAAAYAADDNPSAAYAAERAKQAVIIRRWLAEGTEK